MKLYCIVQFTGNYRKSKIIVTKQIDGCIGPRAGGLENNCKRDKRELLRMVKCSILDYVLLAKPNCSLKIVSFVCKLSFLIKLYKNKQMKSFFLRTLCKTCAKINNKGILPDPNV